MENKLLPDVLMILLCSICIALVLLGLRKALNRTGWPVSRQRSLFTKTMFAILLWVGLLSVLAFLGFFNFSELPPRPVLAVLLATVLLFMIAFSKPFTQLLQVIPPHWLVYIQAFRIGVEALLWLAFTRELLPVQMTWEGYNYDVVSGLLALPAGWAMAKYSAHTKWIGVTYNVIGLLLLLNIIVVSVLSMPTPLQYFTGGPANTIVAEFPFILLPGVLVVLAIALHLFSLRQLLRRQAAYTVAV